MQRQTLTVKEVADYLGVHTDTVYKMVKQQQIPYFKIRRRILFTQVSIDAWMAEQENQNED